jgi:hypothetical protein
MVTAKTLMRNVHRATLRRLHNTTDQRDRLKVFLYDMTDTGYVIAVPPHLDHFTIGNVRFVREYTVGRRGPRYGYYPRTCVGVRALDPIPPSWLVDISGDVE